MKGLKDVYRFPFSVFRERLGNGETEIEVLSRLKSLERSNRIRKRCLFDYSQFPSSELYGLSNQIRRAAVSIPANIAEGQGRHSAKEFRQFLGIALGSISELETHLIISNKIKYLTSVELNPLLLRLDDFRKMLKSLSNSLKVT